MTAEAQIELLRTALSELLDVAMKCDSWEFFPQAALDRANDVLMTTPKGAAAKLRAEAGQKGYYNGFKDALVIEPPLPPATGTYATIDIFAYRVEQASRYAANQYAEQIRLEGSDVDTRNI